MQFNAEKSALVSNSNDGTIMVQQIDYSTLLNQFKGMDYVESYKYPELTETVVKQSNSLFQEQDT